MDNRCHWLSLSATTGRFVGLEDEFALKYREIYNTGIEATAVSCEIEIEHNVFVLKLSQTASNLEQVSRLSRRALVPSRGEQVVKSYSSLESCREAVQFPEPRSLEVKI